MSRETFALGLALALAAALACGRGDDHAARRPRRRRPRPRRSSAARTAVAWLARRRLRARAHDLRDGRAAGVPRLRRGKASSRSIRPALELAVTLRRLGDRVDRIGFAPRGDYLRSAIGRSTSRTRSTSRSWRATAGREHRFAFSSYENRVTLAARAARSRRHRGRRRPGRATIRERVVLNGRIAPNEDALAHVMPRFPGVVRSVHKRLGDSVARGDLLAVIESNESLQPFELRAPLRRHGDREGRRRRGSSSRTTASSSRSPTSSSVWVDLDVYRRDFARLRVGQPVRIDAGDGSAPVESTLAYLSPIGSANTQTLLARAVLPNPDRSLAAGALRDRRGRGRRDSEVAGRGGASTRCSACATGTSCSSPTATSSRRSPSSSGAATRRTSRSSRVSPRASATSRAGSFVLKAEVGKSGASHDH